MKLSEQIAVLEEQFEAVKEGWRQYLEKEFSGKGVKLGKLASSSYFSTHIINQFYPLLVEEKKLDNFESKGMILPLRRLVFHNLKEDIALEDNVLSSITGGLCRRGFHSEYVDFAKDYDKVIHELMAGRLPKDVEPF